MKAVWKDTTLAESDRTVELEGNHYFPPESVVRSRLKKSDTRTVCPWKGQASYYHVVVGHESNEDAAWYYTDPKQAAAQIKDHVAFWKGVRIVP